MTIDKRLQELGLQLPMPPLPVASYVPSVLSGGHLYVSGQLPLKNGQLMWPGHVGTTVTVDYAIEAAQQCAVNILAQAKAALGSLDRVVRVVRLGVFVACGDSFTQQPEVANGASDLMVAVFGEAGKHARAAIGTNALPRGACVEVEAVFAVQA
jgi:enamine deaminase RidA (YjgF/YER057c/UK114 family)